MNHPEVAGRSCADCQAWLYDDAGQGMGARRVQRSGRDVPRPKGSPPPCWKCPKQSPERAREFELTHKNLATLRFYFEVEATHGRCLDAEAAADPTVRRNLGVVKNLLLAVQRNESNLTQLLPLLMATTGRSKR